MEDTRLYHSPDLKLICLKNGDQRTLNQSAFDTDFPFAHLKFDLDCFSLWYELQFQMIFFC